MSIDEAFNMIDGQWRAIWLKTANHDIGNLPESDLKRLWREFDVLFRRVDQARQQMNFALGGYKAHGASKDGNEGEEEGAPSARAEEAEESGSAESDKGAPRHDPRIEKTGDGAKAKPSEDHAAAQAATEDAPYDQR